MASLIDYCGVNGYTANNASASQLRMIAKSVVKTKLLILRPVMIMPLAWILLLEGVVYFCLIILQFQGLH